MLGGRIWNLQTMRWSVVNSLYAKAAVMVFSGTGIWFFAVSEEPKGGRVGR